MPDTVPTTIKIAIAGAGGRMGGALVRAAEAAKVTGVTVAVEADGHSAVGRDVGAVAGIGECGVIVGTVLAGDYDILMEFTTPAATLAHLDVCVELNRAMVIGTTGLDDGAKQQIHAAAKKIPIVFAANTSVGVNVCAALLEIAGGALRDSDIEIVEAHHRDKVDAPSGTALLLAQAATANTASDIATDGVFARHGHTGARKTGSVGFSTIRGGDLAGEHCVMFIGDGERVEITHRATDRRIFAAGAIKAAQWLATQPAGLYDMRDVLGLKTYTPR